MFYNVGGEWKHFLYCLDQCVCVCVCVCVLDIYVSALLKGHSLSGESVRASVINLQEFKHCIIYFLMQK